MNEKNIKNLFNELKLTGATERESEELSLLSKNISNLYNFKRSERLKNKFLYGGEIQNTQPRYLNRVFSVALCSILLLVGYVSTVSAQNSLPGDPLYPVKIASENVVSIINPSFQYQILIRRSEEIKNLSNKNNSYNIYQTIDTYQKDLKKNIDKKNLEESRKNLEQAQKNSLPGYKSQIQNAIIQTQLRQQELDRDVKGESTTSSPKKGSENNNHRGKKSSSSK